jgi:outer membrane receptor protein involved in Fe transport
LVLISVAALAGTTGKLTGHVVDKQSGEALVGVNITVEGTMLGASTNINGDFTILNIPPGTYKVRASLVGYTLTVVNEVRVFIDQTTKVPFDMPQQTVDMGEVIVTAERKAVRADVSTSVAAVTSDDIKTLPISSVQGVTTLQAGVEGGFVIRGGGSDQSLFLLDGATLRDPRNNQPITNVALSAVKEISIERGGFNAEYGQIRSGIVNVVTREGNTQGYTFSFTGRIAPPQSKYMGVSPYDPTSMWLRPYLDPAVAWTGTENGAWDEYTQKQYPTFAGWNAISQQLLTDGDPTNDLSPAGAQRLFQWQHRRTADTKAPDYNIDFGFGGPIPFVADQLGNLRFFLSYRNNREMLMVPLSYADYYEDWWSLRMTSDLGSGMKLDVEGTLGRSQNVAVNGTEQVSSTDYMRTPYQIAAQNDQAGEFVSPARIFVPSYYSLADVKHRSFSALFSHVVSPTTFYEVRAEYIYRSYNAHPMRDRDTTRSYELFPGYYVNEAPDGWSPVPDVGIGDGMFLGGHTSTARDSTKISAFTLKGNLTTQLDVHNQVKAGIEFVYNNLDLKYGIVNVVFPESNTRVAMAQFPIRAALYLQDKLEFTGFIANLGARFDYSSAQTEWPNVSSYDRSYYSAQYDPNAAYPMQKSNAQLIVSPRLGLSHPISENSKLFFNYGHFRQLPTYEQLLRMSRGAAYEMKNIGDPDLLMARTIAYELGYDHSFFDNYMLVQLAAFYRDISDQQAFTQYINARGDVNYQKANNDSYEDIRGFELTVRKTMGRWWAGFINFTYQATSGGHFGAAVQYEDPSAQRQYDQQTSNQYQYKPTPAPFARASVSFFSPDDYGQEGVQRLLLGGWNLTLLGDWRAGGYVTWNPKQVPLSAPNVNMVDWWNLNLRLTKMVPIGPVKLTFLMDVANAFNAKRMSLVSFYDYEDFLAYYGSLHLPASNAYDNIVGDDKAGAYRKNGVEYQPITWVQTTGSLPTTPDNARVIYYVKENGTYMNYANNAWTEVDAGRMQQILDDKAYIDMPNQTSFSFLDPRQIYFGVTLTLDF